MISEEFLWSGDGIFRLFWDVATGWVKCGSNSIYRERGGGMLPRVLTRSPRRATFAVCTTVV
jgi:hypothetical protein